MRREIGSEFWEGPETLHNDTKVQKNENTRWFLAGRSALEHIIRDIKSRIGDFGVAFPSYFCYSMVEPFIRNGITKISFYDVVFENGAVLKFDYDKSCDVIFILDYFGFNSDTIHKIIADAHNRGKIVILDKTQSVFSESDSSSYIDYWFCSYRKWFYTNASLAYSEKGFNIDSPCASNQEYISLRTQGAKEKGLFINKLSDSKEYLEKFHSADKSISTNYVDCVAQADDVYKIQNIDTEAIKKKRQNNALELIQGLKDIEDKYFSFMFSRLSENDVPLFLPIILPTKERQNLRQHLIKNEIYPPIHWGLTPYHKTLTDRQLKIYNTELSLVCDQRYTEEDINREIEVIRSFFIK